MTKTKQKPRKPYPDFPLTPHPNRQWCKKIRGKVHFFGVWAEPDKALHEYLNVRDDLQAGRQPRIASDGLTVADLCNQYLTPKQQRVNTGELSPRTLQEQHATCSRIVKEFGAIRLVEDLRPTDFNALRADIAKTRGPVALSNEVIRVRSVFRFGFESGLMAQRVVFGPNFTKANPRMIREAENRRPLRLLEPHEINSILQSADAVMRAFVCLGLNCGFGAADIGILRIASIDLHDGWISHPRVKTGVQRRIPLWPETIDAIGEAIASRPTPLDPTDHDLAFLTRTGRRWVRTNRSGTPNDELGKRFSRALVKLGLKRAGVSFYALRHCFQTIGEETGDMVAVAAIMGHTDHSMAAHYRERIADKRLLRVVEHVRHWLFAEGKAIG